MLTKLKPALQSSKGRSGPWAGARIINAFAEMSEGDKADLYSIQAIPGLIEFCGNIGSLPVRGAHVVRGAFGVESVYAVAGTSLYSVSSAGSGSLIGTIPGVNPVRIVDNGTELAIHDGDQTGYVYSGGVLAHPVGLTDVSDVAYIDGYFVWTVIYSDQFVISGIDDGTSYDPLDVATVEGSPDQLFGVVNDHRELLFFGDQTIEIWVNTGASDFPFERQGNAFIERGCNDRNSITKLDNGTWFVGEDRIVYRLNGYTPERMSTHAVEKTLAEATWFRAFTYTQEGHKFYVLNTDAGTWACDIATSNAWAERQSFELDYYRCGGSVTAYGYTLFASNQTGKIYRIDLDSDSEDGTAMPVTIELPALGDGVSRQTLYAFELFMETGVGDLTTTDPQAILTYSKNGGRGYSNEMWRPLGAQGEYTTRAVWRVNIEFRQLQLKIQFPDKVRRCVIGYWADVR